MLGEEVAMVALLLDAAGHGPGAVTAVLVVTAFPFIARRPWAGRLVDRSDDRRLTSLTGLGFDGRAAGSWPCRAGSESEGVERPVGAVVIEEG